MRCNMMRLLLRTGPCGRHCGKLWAVEGSTARVQDVAGNWDQRAPNSGSNKYGLSTDSTTVSSSTGTSTSGRATALPEHFAALRRFNCARPDLLGQAILLRIIEVGPSHLLVDPGYHGTCILQMHDFRSSRVHDRQGTATDRTLADGVKAGEYVVATLARYYTPFGTMELVPTVLTSEVRRELVWAELRQLHATRAAVWGRVLNLCGSGYAVGVAGVVCLLPFERCSASTGRPVGVLQPFHIISIDDRQRLVTLCDEAHRPQAAAPPLRELYSNI